MCIRCPDCGSPRTIGKSYNYETKIAEFECYDCGTCFSMKSNDKEKYRVHAVDTDNPVVFESELEKWLNKGYILNMISCGVGYWKAALIKNPKVIKGVLDEDY